MVRADGTDDRNWVIWEFLHKIKKPNLPVNLFIPADPSKETIFFNTLISQKNYIESANAIGGGGA